MLLPHTMGPAAVAKMRAPTSLSCPPLAWEDPMGLRGWCVPPCWTLPAPGSDSFCCSGLWVWMSHLFLTMAAAASPGQGLLLPAQRDTGRPVLMVPVPCAVSDHIRPQTCSKTSCPILWFPRNPVASLASRNPVHRTC